MSDHLSFPPLENGLDYMKSAVEHLSNAPNDRDLKYGILHLAAAIEVLLKMRLIREHWTLVFEHSNKTSEEKYNKADFSSVSSPEAVRRLREVAGIPISQDDSIRIEKVIARRNKLQHFGLNESAEAIQSVAAEALNFLITFVEEHLRDSEALPEDPVEETLEHIRSQLSSIEVFVTTRMHSLSSELSAYEILLKCPVCSRPALIVGESCLCKFCGFRAAPEEMATEYVSDTFLTNGQSSVHECPSCERETLVDRVDNHRVETSANRHDRNSGLKWICFAENCSWDQDEMDLCTGCDEPTTELDDHYNAMCGECFSSRHSYSEDRD